MELCLYAKLGLARVLLLNQVLGCRDEVCKGVLLLLVFAIFIPAQEKQSPHAGFLSVGSDNTATDSKALQDKRNRGQDACSQK